MGATTKRWLREQSRGSEECCKASTLLTYVVKTHVMPESLFKNQPESCSKEAGTGFKRPVQKHSMCATTTELTPHCIQ